jgi:hypothetical protein
MYLESKRVKIHMTQAWIKLHVVNRRGRLVLVRGGVQLDRLGRITLTVVFGFWNAWVYACANHTRPTRGTRRGLSL